MSKVIFDKDGRIGRISLNRPEKLNAIDDDLLGPFFLFKLKNAGL